MWHTVFRSHLPFLLLSLSIRWICQMAKWLSYWAYAWYWQLAFMSSTHTPETHYIPRSHSNRDIAEIKTNCFCFYCMCFCVFFVFVSDAVSITEAHQSGRMIIWLWAVSLWQSPWPLYQPTKPATANGERRKNHALVDNIGTALCVCLRIWDCAWRWHRHIPNDDLCVVWNGNIWQWQGPGKTCYTRYRYRNVIWRYVRIHRNRRSSLPPTSMSFAQSENLTTKKKT